MATDAPALPKRFTKGTRPPGIIADRAFQIIALLAALMVLVILGLIAVSTTREALPWFREEGLGIFTDTWDPSKNSFGALGLIPDTRPTRGDVFGSIGVDYKLVLNVLGAAVFAALFWLTMRRGATDPVCGMKVDRARAVTAEHGGRRHFFCSDRCRDAFTGHPA